MATVVSVPVMAWLAALNAGGFVSAGQSNTVTVHLTQGLEIQVPVGVRYGSNVSLAAAVFVYPSNDGGANYDTVPLLAFSIPTTASVNQIASIRLATGQYAIRTVISSPSCTVFVLTQAVITAIANT